jgi:hypothetical protein
MLNRAGQATRKLGRCAYSDEHLARRLHINTATAVLRVLTTDQCPKNARRSDAIADLGLRIADWKSTRLTIQNRKSKIENRIE